MEGHEEVVSTTEWDTSDHFWGCTYSPLGPPKPLLKWCDRPASGGRDLVYEGGHEEEAVSVVEWEALDHFWG
jgi:hypothetical protein